MGNRANIDIHNLFSKFGGNPNTYQEIQRDVSTEHALNNWPIIAAMKNELQAPPRLRQPAPVTTSPQQRPEPTLVQQVTSSFKAHEVVAAGQTANTPPPAPGSLQSLFGSLETVRVQEAKPQQNTSAQPAATPVDAIPASDGSLNNVFSRLLNSSQPKPITPTSNTLQSMLGRLTKQ